MFDCFVLWYEELWIYVVVVVWNCVGVGVFWWGDVVLNFIYKSIW